MMTTDSFNERYGKEGGVNMLVEMIESCCRRSEIATHFGVSNDRVRQWCDELGLPRPNHHRCRIHKEMIEVHKRYGMDAVTEQFKSSKWYESGLRAIDDYYHAK